MAVERYMPEAFDFYSLGQVRLLSPGHGGARLPFEPRALVRQRLGGDGEGDLLVFFDRVPEGDPSLSLELANLALSMAVSRGVDEGGLRVELGPPSYLEREERAFQGLELLVGAIALGAGCWRSEYRYEGKGGPIHMLIHFIPARRGQA